MIEDEQKYIDKANLEKLRKRLPEECRGCNILRVINLRKQKVYCPYRINNTCLIDIKKKTKQS